jgi:hypothetical protein
LLPSNSALVLQSRSGPSSDLLAKILGVDTSMFLWKMQFYFLLSLLLVHILVNCDIIMLSAIAQVVECLLMVLKNFHYHVYYGYGDHQISFKSLHLFITFLPSFTFENDRRASGFSVCYYRNQIKPNQTITTTIIT